VNPAVASIQCAFAHTDLQLYLTRAPQYRIVRSCPFQLAF
jgi:hypothetical protein